MPSRFFNSGLSFSRTANLPTITAYTVMGWFYISGDNDLFNTFFSFGQNTAALYYQIACDQTSTNSRLAIWNSTATVTGSNMLSNTWYHIALTCAGTGIGQLLGYLNGGLDITANGNSNPTNAKLWVGNDPDGDWLNGRVLRVRLYSRVLTQSEIYIEYQNRANFFPKNWISLNWFGDLDNQNDAIAENQPSGFNWTVTGPVQHDQDPYFLPSVKRRRRVSQQAAAASNPAVYNVNRYIGLGGLVGKKTSLIM